MENAMNKAFFIQLGERALKTAAQATLALVTAEHFNWLHSNFAALASTVATATLASVLTSLASINPGHAGSPSLVAVQPAAEHLGPPAN